MATSRPLTVEIELSRLDEVADAFAIPEGRQEYAWRSEAGGRTEVPLRWDTQMRADLEAVRRPGRDPVVVARLGERLRKALQPAGWSALAGEIRAAVDAGRRVVVGFRFNGAELYALPWELLATAQGGEPLGSLPGVLIRYAWPDSATTPPRPAPRPEGGRILFAWSASAGQLPSSAHQRAIADACQRGHHPFDAEDDVLRHASADRLVERLRVAEQAGAPVAVLHLLCHGTTAGSTFGLALDGPQGEVAVVDALRLTQLLRPFAASLRLIVLAACDGGNIGALGNHLGSLALRLHVAGFAAVVASRYPLSTDGSVTFAERCYQTLLEGPASLETAFLAARAELANNTAHLDWASLQLYARAQDGDDHRPIVVRPYRGLLGFRARHARFLFGREDERRETLGDMAALIAAGRPRFLVVAGASGTGKSSMVLAGAVPDLIAADPSWRATTMRPARNPLGALDDALRTLDGAERRLLVVDQFEEIFTQVDDAPTRQAFVQRLWQMAAEPSSGFAVIVTIRVDFLGDCGQIVLDASGRRLDAVAYDEAHRVFVAQMRPEQMRAAIERPADRVGVQLEAGLVERMLDDVAGEPGALPAVSYTLDLLWEQRVGRTLTQAAYDALGGVAGALNRRADALVDGFDVAEKRQARRLMVRLVTVGVDGAPDTRRQLPIQQARPTQAEQIAAFDAALRRLVDARLLVRGEADGAATVEVAHESLIRRWPRLRAWIKADHDMLSQVAEVEGWVAQWRQHGTLLQGDQLGYAQRVREKFPHDVSESVAALTEASDAAQMAATRRRRGWIIGALAATAIVAVVMALLAIRAEVAASDAAEKGAIALAANKAEREAAQTAREQSAEADRQRKVAIQQTAAAKEQLVAQQVTSALKDIEAGRHGVGVATLAQVHATFERALIPAHATTIARFWLPLLEPGAARVARAGRPSVVRWQGRDHVVDAAGDVHRFPAHQVAWWAATPGKPQLVTWDSNREVLEVFDSTDGALVRHIELRDTWVMHDALDFRDPRLFVISVKRDTGTAQGIVCGLRVFDAARWTHRTIQVACDNQGETARYCAAPEKFGFDANGDLPEAYVEASNSGWMNETGLPICNRPPLSRTPVDVPGVGLTPETARWSMKANAPKAPYRHASGFERFRLTSPLEGEDFMPAPPGDPRGGPACDGFPLSPKDLTLSLSGTLGVVDCPCSAKTSCFEVRHYPANGRIRWWATPAPRTGDIRRLDDLLFVAGHVRRLPGLEAVRFDPRLPTIEYRELPRTSPAAAVDRWTADGADQLLVTVDGAARTYSRTADGNYGDYRALPADPSLGPVAAAAWTGPNTALLQTGSHLVHHDVRTGAVRWRMAAERPVVTHPVYRGARLNLAVRADGVIAARWGDRIQLVLAETGTPLSTAEAPVDAEAWGPKWAKELVRLGWRDDGRLEVEHEKGVAVRADVLDDAALEAALKEAARWTSADDRQLFVSPFARVLEGKERLVAPPR